MIEQRGCNETHLCRECPPIVRHKGPMSDLEFIRICIRTQMALYGDTFFPKTFVIQEKGMN